MSDPDDGFLGTPYYLRQGTTGGTTMELTEAQQAEMLRAEMDRQRVTNNQMRAGIAAIAMGESGFKMQPEQGYAHTSLGRIRQIFGGRVSMLSDVQLDALKLNEDSFFNFVYGGTWGTVNLGNTQPGDGFKFRGRGLFQLTGRANYERYGSLIGIDLVRDPEIADDPKVACAVAVAYMRDRYRGGGWEGLKKAVGNNIPDIATRKDELYNRFRASGEFAAKPDVATTDWGQPVRVPIPPPSLVDEGGDEIARFKAAVERMQTFLKSKGKYGGRIDGDFGCHSRQALQSYLEER